MTAPTGSAPVVMTRQEITAARIARFEANAAATETDNHAQSWLLLAARERTNPRRSR